MNRNPELIALGDLLTLVSRPEPVEADKTYRILGAHWYAKGLYVKEICTGTEICASKVYRVEQGDFVYNRLFAWKGSFAVATEENHNCFVSNEFPCFSINREKLNTEYLWYCFSRESAWAEAFGLSTGGTPTSRNRLKVEKLLSIKMPLPPLSEQQRVAKKLNLVSEKSFAVHDIHSKTQQEERALLLSVFSDIKKEAKWHLMKDVAPIVRRPTQIDATSEYLELGIRSFGRGTFHKPALPGSGVGTKKLYQIRTGDLMFSNVFAWEGAIAVAQQEDDGRYGSHRFISCVPDPAIAVPGFLCFYFLTNEGLQKIGEASPGGAGRNRTLGLNKLERIQVPLPSLKQQTRFMLLLEKIRSADSHRAAVQAKLESLLSSAINNAFTGEL